MAICNTIELVSIGIIAYNEEEYLPNLLNDIKNQDYPHEKIEILLVDGMSSDATKRLMLDFSKSRAASAFSRVAVYDNPKKVLPSGCNILLKNFSGDALVRVDAHARIPADFIRVNVLVLEEGEYISAGPRPAKTAKTDKVDATELPKYRFAETLLLAENSAFGSSAAEYRFSATKEYVDSAFHAMFRREVIETVGLYNEKLHRTEDNDYFYRVFLAGYRIRFDRRIYSEQIARNTLQRMLKQKYGNGYWIGRTMYVQPKCFKMYHFAPLAFVLGILLVTLIGIQVSWLPFISCAAIYVLLCLVLSLRAVLQTQRYDLTQVALPVVFLLIHLSYGVGTVVGLAAGLISPLT